MTEEKSDKRPALNYQTHIKMQSESQGSFRLRAWKMRDSEDIFELCRTQLEPRGFAEQMIHHQIEPPGPSIDDVRGWSEEFLLHVAGKWWQFCEQHPSNPAELRSLTEFRAAIAAKCAREQEALTGIFARAAITSEVGHGIGLKVPLPEPMHPATAALECARLLGQEPTIRRLAELTEYSASGLTRTAEEARIHSQHFLVNDVHTGMRKAVTDMVSDESQRHSGLLKDLSRDFPNSLAALGQESANLQQLKETRLFSMPHMDEVQSLMRQLDLHATLPAIDPVLSPKLTEIEAAIRGIRSPWMDMAHAADSLTSIIGLASLGKAVQHAFENASNETLRAYLGDFGRFAAPESINWDWQERQALYIDTGFDTRLTTLPDPAFDDALSSTGLLPPELLSSAFNAKRKQATSRVIPAREEALKERMQEAYDILFTFETELRVYLHEKMPQQFGATWIKQRVPGPMREQWEQKRDQAKQKGEEELPLLWYADFSDYIGIIIRSDNWRDFFVNVFRSKDDVNVSFQRLQPLRICTMHCRPITKEDMLMLSVEVQRVLKRIGKLK